MVDRMGSGATRVAYQGERGAFSEEAAYKLLGAKIETQPCRTFEEMFDVVARSRADCAVAPIENSLAGPVQKNYDLLIEHGLVIKGGASLRIIHNLIAPEAVAFEQVKRVYSHPVALAQCERFLRANPQLEVVPAYDTAGSVKMIIDGGRGDEAAIAAARAAEHYGARIIRRGVEDDAKNFTRFLLLARPGGGLAIEAQGDAGARKTTVAFRVSNNPGALFRALAAFALRDIDVANVESRPIAGRPWEYTFYLDLIGDGAEPRVGRALAHLAEMAETMRVLGSYPESNFEREVEQ